MSVSSDLHERELREAEIKRLWDALEHERELREQERQSQTAALRLQAVEYERRLDSLNHAHQAAMEAQAQTVPRETFDIYKLEQDRWRGQVTETLAESRGASQRAVSMSLEVKAATQLRLAIVGVGLTIFTIVLGLVLRFIPNAP